MSASSRVLDRLTGIKRTGELKWLAVCPAHPDKSPSLSIREIDDGRILLHCFAGCANGDVLAALGLRFTDLFDKPIAQHLPPVRAGWSARELLEVSAHEITVAALITNDAARRRLNTSEIDRLIQAAGRLNRLKGLLS